MRAAVTLLLLAGLAACGEETPPPPVSYVPLSYDYLRKLRLNVSNITIEDAWLPPPDGTQHVESLAPTPPVAALRQMAADRLVAGGGPGQATFTITDASLTRGQGQLIGSFSVRLVVQSGTAESGTRRGEATASVSGTRAVTDSPDGERAAAYELVRTLMDQMNVEFEYQVRKSLRDQLQSGEATQGPVQTQDLAPPPRSVP